MGIEWGLLERWRYSQLQQEMDRDVGAVTERLDRVDDSLKAIASELDKWLRAAGFETIESRDEFSC